MLVIYFGDQRITNSMLTRNKNFLARVNKKQNVEIESPASS